MTQESTARKLEAVRRAVEAAFGFTELKPHQEEVLTHVLEGRDVLVNLSTGSGKSLCYQAPSLIEDEGLTIVVSPLIALMHDQVGRLAAAGIPAVYIDSTLEKAERAAIVRSIQGGVTRLLYVSPETLNTNRIYDALEGIRVKRLVVDEAHCVSMWGHDFRPPYLKIAAFRHKLGGPQLLAFTATAPVVVRDEIIKYLELEDAVRIVGEIERPNIQLENLKFAGKAEKWSYLYPQLRQHQRDGHATVVYCRRIWTVKEIAERLRSDGKIRFLPYHGELEAEERSNAARQFLEQKLPVLIATKAFGMGIDHPSIRYIYHFEIPESLEEYYQEVGRAGRDGKPAKATLLYHRQDIGDLGNFILTSNPGYQFLGRVYNLLWQSRIAKDLEAKGQRRAFLIRRLLAHIKEKNPHMEAKVRTSISQLEEYGVIEQWSNQLRFLVLPEGIQKTGLPISADELDAKRDRDMLRLKVMLHYANSESASARSLILDHFRSNTVVEQVKDMPLSAFYRLPEEIIRAVCGAVAEADQPKGSLSGYLLGRNSIKGAYSGSLKSGTVAELSLDIEQVSSLGYIRHVPVGETTYYTVTELGLDYLARNGVAVPEITRLNELRRRMYSPQARTLLRDTIKEWWRWQQREPMRPKDWWRLVENFQAQQFTLLGTTVNGEQLTRAFRHIHPRSKMFLRYSKELLNYLFDNKIVT